MNALLPRIRDYLKSPEAGLGGLIREIACKPEAWIYPNLKTINFPACFIWSVAETDSPGIATDTREKSLIVQIKVIMQSIDPDFSSFDNDRGIFTLSNKILSALTKNKKLKLGSQPGIVTGIDLPIRQVDSQLVGKGVFYAIARDITIVYKDEFLPWSWRENEETGDF